MFDTGLPEMVKENVREFYFQFESGKFKSLKKVMEKWNFKSTYLLFFLYFCCFLTFKIISYILRSWIMLYWENMIVHEIERQADFGFSRKPILLARCG